MFPCCNGPNLTSGFPRVGPFQNGLCSAHSWSERAGRKLQPRGWGPLPAHPQPRNSAPRPGPQGAYSRALTGVRGTSTSPAKGCVRCCSWGAAAAPQAGGSHGGHAVRRLRLRWAAGVGSLSGRRHGRNSLKSRSAALTSHTRGRETLLQHRGAGRGAPPPGAREPAGLRHPSTWAIPPLGRVCLGSALEAREGQGRPQETGRVLRETAGLRKVSQRPHGRATRRHCSAPPVAAESGRTGRPLGCSDPHHRRVTRGHSLGVRGLPVEQPNPMHALLTARDLERPQRAGHPLEHQATGLLHSPEHLRKQFLR